MWQQQLDKQNVIGSLQKKNASLGSGCQTSYYKHVYALLDISLSFIENGISFPYIIMYWWFRFYYAIHFTMLQIAFATFFSMIN